MSDQRLRDLERRWRASGSPDEEAAHLRERVRVGDLSTDRLRAAAALGHGPACQALAEPVDDENWHLAFMNLEPVAFVRAAVAALDHAIDTSHSAHSLQAMVSDITRLARVWCREPTEAARRRVLGLVQRRLVTFSSTRLRLFHTTFPLVRQIGHIVGHQTPTNTWTSLPFLGNQDQVSPFLVRSDVRAAVAADMVPWLLGYGDPLLERHAGSS